MLAAVEAQHLAVDSAQKTSVRDTQAQWIGTEAQLRDIGVAEIDPSPYQPRLYFDPTALEELATSIQVLGLGTPILVRPLENGRYELVGGERRWRASKLNGATTITAIIKPMSDGAAMLLALTDNEKEDLSDYELGKSYYRIINEGEEGSIRALARRLGINHSSISRCLAMMELPVPIRSVLDKNPRLITLNYVKRFIDLSAANTDIVHEVVQLMADNGVQQEAALREIEKRIATLNPADPNTKAVNRVVSGIGAMKITGQRIELKCVKGVSVQLLSNLFEDFLKNIDVTKVKEGSPE